MAEFEWKHKLTNEEIRHYYDRGWIPKNTVKFYGKFLDKIDPVHNGNILTVATRPEKYGLKPISIYTTVYGRSIWDYDSYFFSDLCLIRIASSYEDNKISYFPLESIESFQVVAYDIKEFNVSGITQTSSKSPVKGAVIGGIVAGTAGAIVGAIANQGSRTQNLTYNSSQYIYKLAIKIKDMDLIEYPEYKVLKTSTGDSIGNTAALTITRKINNENSMISELLDRTKNIVTEEDRMNIFAKYGTPKKKGFFS